MTPKAIKATAWLLVLLSFGSLAALQLLTDRADTSLKREVKLATINASEPLIPKVQALRALSLGNPSVVADLLWLKTIQYFGSGNPYGKYPSLGPLLTSITQLDSRFAYPYEFGLIVLPFMDQAQTAITLGEQAQTAIPGNGLLTYYLATDYHLNIKDYRKAAFYYQKSAGEPGAPEAAKALAGITLSQLDENSTDRLVAREFWRTIYQNAKTDEDKERAQKWFDQMDIVYAIETASQAYHAKTGKYAANQQELVDAGFLPTVYVSPIDRLLLINPTNGMVDFSQLDPNAQQ